jgi:hypothetical protein
MFKTFAALLLLAAAAAPASAALFVSGDYNIVDVIADSAPNQQFFRNIVDGKTVVVQESTAYSFKGVDLVNFYNGAGFSASLLGTAASVSAINLAGVDLFIGFAPDDAYTADEVTAMRDFLDGGGNILFTGDNDYFTQLNADINAALVGLGSGLAIVPDSLGPGFNDATLQGPSRYLDGTACFQFASVSRVTGGLGLFGTNDDNITFLAVEGATVPEPASWAMLIAGFGLTGAVMRRRRNAVAA